MELNSSVDDATRSIILEYLKGPKCSEFENSLLQSLFLIQRYELIHFALESGFILTENIIAEIRKSGNLRLYQYLNSHQKLIFNYELLFLAVISGSLESVKWLWPFGHIHHYDIYTVQKLAAENGHLHILKWLREIKIYISEKLLEHAVEYGQLEILQWMVEIGYKPEKYFVAIAARKEHFHIVQWLEQTGNNYNQQQCV